MILGLGKSDTETELQSCECYGEAYMSVQQFRNRRVLTGYFTADSVLQVSKYLYVIINMFQRSGIELSLF